MVKSKCPRLRRKSVSLIHARLRLQEPLGPDWIEFHSFFRKQIFSALWKISKK